MCGRQTFWSCSFARPAEWNCVSMRLGRLPWIWRGASTAPTGPSRARQPAPSSRLSAFPRRCALSMPPKPPDQGASLNHASPKKIMGTTSSTKGARPTLARLARRAAALRRCTHAARRRRRRTRASPRACASPASWGPRSCCGPSWPEGGCMHRR
jgi:hypothetical protein